MELMPTEVADQVPALYSQDGKGGDAIVRVKLFTPWSGWTWMITEYDPSERLAFGWAHDASYPDGAELGYVSIDELESLRGPAGLTVERDLHFTPKSMDEAQREIRERFA